MIIKIPLPTQNTILLYKKKTKQDRVERLCRKHPILKILTFQELNVLCLIGLGYTNKEIAEELYVSPRTVEIHRKNIMFKLNAKSRKDLVKIFIETGLILPYLPCTKNDSYCFKNKKLCPGCKKFYF